MNPPHDPNHAATESLASHRIRQVLLTALGLTVFGAVGFLAYHHARPPHFCPPGMVALAARCCGEGQRLNAGHCTGKATRCAAGMQARNGSCQAVRKQIYIKGGLLDLGPVDWEAQRQVRPYRATVPPFLIDSHEVTAFDYERCRTAGKCVGLKTSVEAGLPRVGISLAEAEQYCRWRQGSLPNRDQYAFAVMGEQGTRYPWGQTGAVCRRAAFGLADGPCSQLGNGPQLAGSHPSGASAEGVHDLAGNAAEWVKPHRGHAQIRGGSWRTVQAATLRGWSFQPVTPNHRSDDVGFRCVYPDTATAHAKVNPSPKLSSFAKQAP